MDKKRTGIGLASSRKALYRAAGGPFFRHQAETRGFYGFRASGSLLASKEKTHRSEIKTTFFLDLTNRKK
jgi:hypothetical protein